MRLHLSYDRACSLERCYSVAENSSQRAEAEKVALGLPVDLWRRSTRNKVDSTKMVLISSAMVPNP